MCFVCVCLFGFGFVTNVISHVLFSHVNTCLSDKRGFQHTITARGSHQACQNNTGTEPLCQKLTSVEILALERMTIIDHTRANDNH